MISAGMLQKQFEQFDATCLCCAMVTVPEKTMMSRTNKLQKTDKNQTVGGYSRPSPQSICFSIIDNQIYAYFSPKLKKISWIRLLLIILCHMAKNVYLYRTKHLLGILSISSASILSMECDRCEDMCTLKYFTATNSSILFCWPVFPLTDKLDIYVASKCLWYWCKAVCHALIY